MKSALRFVIITFCALAFVPAHAESHTEAGLINMQGQGEVAAEPDTAYVTSGVVAEAKTAQEALQENTAAMAALIEVLKTAGIEDRDIQTSGFSVQPVYVYSDQRNADGYQQPPRIEAYRVANNVTVRVRDIANLGTILDDMVSVGANTINNVSFAVDDASELMNAARREAMADAIAKAELYADAAGVGLGPIVSISENGGYNPPPQPLARVEMMAADSKASVPMQGGEVNYAITVSVQWEISQ